MRKAVACTSLVWLASLGGSLAFVAFPPSARPGSSFTGDGPARGALSTRSAQMGTQSRWGVGNKVESCSRRASKIKCVRLSHVLAATVAVAFLERRVPGAPAIPRNIHGRNRGRCLRVVVFLNRQRGTFCVMAADTASTAVHMKKGIG